MNSSTATGPNPAIVWDNRLPWLFLPLELLSLARL